MFTLASSREPQSVTFSSQMRKTVSSSDGGNNHRGHVPLSDNDVAISANKGLTSDGAAWKNQDIVNRAVGALSLDYSAPADSLSEGRSQSLVTNGTAAVPVTSAVVGLSSPSAFMGPISGQRQKVRRRKPRIELAPNQPPTTHGNPRARVYIACSHCRTRKIRCDGAKPICHNCKQRAGAECRYDALPKRRGPDRTPGARQRVMPYLPPDGIGGAPGQRRTRQGTDTAQISSPRPLSHCQDHTIQYIIPFSEYPASGIAYSPVAALNVETPSAQVTLLSGAIYPTGLPVLYYTEDGYPDEAHDEWGSTEPSDPAPLGNEPSLNFARKVWWDSLLCLYISPPSTRVQTLTVDERDKASRSIVSDLRFVFRTSNYWFSFFHIPTFFREFYDPVKREGIQPCLVLALLAMSTFWRSSDVGMGVQGRERALRFRDEAQAALEASINTRWVDETLVQAAWVLALFEACAHPRYSEGRLTSALVLLDSLIHSLSLTFLDADDTETSLFSPRSVPSASGRANQNQCLRQNSTCLIAHAPLTSMVGCDCKALTLAANWPLTNEHVPLWGPTPAWHATWTTGHIRKESCRRLCWSSMALAAGYVACQEAYQKETPDLFLTNPINYALLFSGELAARSSVSPSQNSPKNTIWALYDQCYLLWHGCIRMRYGRNIPDTEKGQFAVEAWLEADALEAALNRHTCNLERASLYQAREYIFNTRMCISYEYQRWVPSVTTNVSNLFHRRKAEEWLTHQASVARGLMDGLHTITGNNGNVLATRPFFVFWFMGQINRAMSLWEYDNSLMTALDVCKAFIVATDYLTSLWPCPEQRREYQDLRGKVGNACYIAGVCPPPPLDLKVILLKSLDTLV